MGRTIGILAILGCGVVSAFGQSGYPVRLPGTQMASYRLHGTCEAVVQPDVAIIAGGVTGKGLKPTDAVHQLEKQLDLMKEYVKGQHGQLVLMERVRTIRAPRVNTNNVAMGDDDQPAEVVQHIHVELSPDAPLDAILDRLIELGMDRYGDAGLLNRSSQSTIVIQFRVSDIESRLMEMRHKCLETAVKLLCVPDARPKSCSSDKLPDQLTYEQFNVHSMERLLRTNGSSDFLRFNYNNGALQNVEPPEFAGAQPIKLTGEFTAQYSEPQ